MKAKDIERAERFKRSAIVAGCPDCEHILFEQYLKEHPEGYVSERLLPKGWLLSDYSPTENLIEIEDLNDGARFWPHVEDLFFKNHYPGQKVMILKAGAVHTTDKEFQVMATMSRFTVETRRKRCYLQALFVPADQEAAQS